MRIVVDMTPLRRPSLTRVVEEPPENRGLLGGSGSSKPVVTGNLGPMVSQKSRLDLVD